MLMLTKRWIKVVPLIKLGVGIPMLVLISKRRKHVSKIKGSSGTLTDK